MKVVPIAATIVNFGELNAAGYLAHDDVTPAVTDSDELAEFAGRMCYQSWSRPNPATATNAGYLKNIIAQGHFSVLEHASVSFYVEGVSRALLTELERHRHLSYSVVSQRYVHADSMGAVVPPALEDNAATRIYGDDIEFPYLLPEQATRTVRDEFNEAINSAFDAYGVIANRLQQVAGLPRKKALEAARSVLPNATEVKMVVTGNIRAWRDVIAKRYHEAADEEIKAFASEVLTHLRAISPNSVQDIPEVPYA